MRPADRTEPPKGSHSSWAPRTSARALLQETSAIDSAIHDAVAGTPTPTLDVAMSWISNAATYSRIWVVIAAALALTGGERGRQTAIRGVTAIVTTSVTADLLAKNLLPPRDRPVRSTPIAGRQARMPTSSSFPSGHTASAFAFATVVTAGFPRLSLPLYALATAVGYSRVHMGVHYPSDVMGGAVLGLAVGTALRDTRS